MNSYDKRSVGGLAEDDAAWSNRAWSPVQVSQQDIQEIHNGMTEATRARVQG